MIVNNDPLSTFFAIGIICLIVRLLIGPVKKAPRKVTGYIPSPILYDYADLLIRVSCAPTRTEVACVDEEIDGFLIKHNGSPFAQQLHDDLKEEVQKRLNMLSVEELVTLNR